MRPLVYIAGPLFNAIEKDFNRRLREIILPHADVFLPQLDGGLLVDMMGKGCQYQEAVMHVFKCDTDALRACNAFLIVLNGRTADEGACFELGVAWSLHKDCFGFKDDTRRLLQYGDNPMITGALRSVFRTCEEVEEWAKTLSCRNAA